MNFEFRKVQTADMALNLVQDQLVFLISNLNAVPAIVPQDRKIPQTTTQSPITGVVLRDVKIPNTAVLVPHSLGRRPSGWFAFNLKQNVVIWQDESAFLGTSPTAQRDLFLNLVCNVTPSPGDDPIPVDIFVF